MPAVAEQPTGNIFIRDFDLGIVEYLGGTEYSGNYYFLDPNKIISAYSGENGPSPILIPPLFPDDHGIPSEVGKQMPGIPIIFENPNEIGRYVLPSIRIAPEDLSPALERMNGYHLKYKCPAPGANPLTVPMGNSGATVDGYDKYESQEGARPYDIPYTIHLGATGNAARTNANAMLKYAMTLFQPNGSLEVYDTLGDKRWYTFFTEGPSSLSIIGDIGDRAIINSLSVRVLGELDVYNAVTSQRLVTAQPIINL